MPPEVVSTQLLSGFPEPKMAVSVALYVVAASAVGRRMLEQMAKAIKLSFDFMCFLDMHPLRVRVLVVVKPRKDK